MSTIRVRLTAWYVAILTLATLTLAGGSWWLSTQSVIRAADSGLAARIDGVRAFLDDPRTILTVEELEDEFREYAELTRGEALLQVINPTGAVLCQPAIPGWLEMEAALAVPGSTGTQSATDRTIGAHPYRVAVATITARGQQYRVTVAAPMGAAYAALNRFHQWLLGLLPGVLLLSAAGGYVMSRRALAPVDQISRAVQAITLQSLDRRVPVPPANDELSRLAVTFNAVLGRLDDAVQDIVRFTADASHELRTPVALVRTTAELALRHPRTAHEYREALADVANHAQHMTQLVDDLLALARTDAGLESRRQLPVDVSAVLVQVIDDIRSRSISRTLMVDVDVPPSPVVVAGEGSSLQRLFVILLDNAVKYQSMAVACASRSRPARR